MDMWRNRVWMLHSTFLYQIAVAHKLFSPLSKIWYKQLPYNSFEKQQYIWSMSVEKGKVYNIYVKRIYTLFYPFKEFIFFLMTGWIIITLLRLHNNFPRGHTKYL